MILEIIHPQLGISKGGIHKTIEAPMYSYVEDDTIYTFITRYRNYLLHEELSTEKRAYNKREQTMFVLNVLTFDKRFKEGLTYMEATLQAFQRDTRISSMTPFSLELKIDESAMKIDERSDSYVIGDNITSAQVINPYAKSNIRMIEAAYIASIHAMGRRIQPHNDNYKKAAYKNVMINLQVETPKCTKYV